MEGGGGGGVTKLEHENADLVADVETLKEWSDTLHKGLKVINQENENLFDDIRNKANLFQPGTDHTDNCDVSVLSTTVCLKLVNSQGIAICIATFSPRQ